MTAEVHAQLRQVTAAAAVESAAAPAAATAAARLVVFFPLHELLSLTQQALSLATSAPSPEVANLLTSSKPSRAKQLTPAWVLQSGLDLADALINLVIGSDDSGGLSRLDYPYTDLDPQRGDGSQGGATGGQEGSKDAWARIVEGLLAMALMQRDDKAVMQRADMLLLKLSAVNGTKPAAAIFARQGLPILSVTFSF